MKSTKSKVNVTQRDDAPEVTRDVLAQAIVDISSAATKLASSGLTRDAIVVLVHHNCRAPYVNKTKPTLAEIRAVLDSMEDLRRKFVTR